MARRISAIVPLLFITLLCVGGVEGGYLALEYFFMKAAPMVQEVAKLPAARQQQKTAPVAQKADYRIILERNLFGQPPTVGKVEAEKERDPLKDLQATRLKIALKGTVSAKGGRDWAIILDEQKRTQELYQRGDGIQGAIVKEILRGKVVLSYEGRDEFLDMSDIAGSAAPAGPVAVAPVSGLKNRVLGGGAGVQRKPARRIVKPRVLRPTRRLREQQQEQQQE